MQQIGEKLRVTCDDIDYLNPGLEGQMGKGRLNVLKALTQSSPSIRNQNLTINNNKAVAQGDTMQVYLDLKNFLDPAAGLSLTLTSTSSFIHVLNPQLSVGDMGTLERRNGVGPFNVVISTSVPNNSTALFKITYSANKNTYNDFEAFTVPINVDYINVTVNSITTTLTSNGRVGYSSPGESNGLGFIYKNKNLLYEASLMVGNSPLSVSNNARNPTGSDNHFVTQIKASRHNPSAPDFDGEAEFQDTGSPNPLKIFVKNVVKAYQNPPDDKYAIVEYTIYNKNTSRLSGLYIGLFTDWDVDVNGKDITRYDSFGKLCYTYGKSGNTVYAGIKLLSNTAFPVYYPLSKEVPGNPLFDGFTTADKFQALSSGVAATSLGENSANGIDVAFVSGYGPYSIRPDDSVKVAFAFIAGDNLQDLVNTAAAAQKKYSIISSANEFSSQPLLKQNFPNPSQNNTVIQFSIPDPGITTLDIDDIQGHRIQVLVDQNLQGGDYSVTVNTVPMPPGMYIYKLRHKTIEKSLKMIVIK
jgi:hypothetical protein